MDTAIAARLMPDTSNPPVDFVGLKMQMRQDNTDKSKLSVLVCRIFNIRRFYLPEFSLETLLRVTGDYIMRELLWYDRASYARCRVYERPLETGD